MLNSLLSVANAGGLLEVKYASLSMLFRTLNPFGLLTVWPSTQRLMPI